MDSPFMTLIRCGAALSFECGMWLGLGGIVVPGCSRSAMPQRDLVSPSEEMFIENSANQARLREVEPNHYF
jgi:hypothetical protein